MPISTKVLLVASGHSRQSANEMCWPAQQEMESRLTAAVLAMGSRMRRAHTLRPGQ